MKNNTVKFNLLYNRKGVIGSFSVTFIAIIIIAALLISMVVFSSIIKQATNANGEIVLQEEDSLGITDGVGYMENYAKLVEARMNDDLTLDDALVEVGYEK
jgi:hypothetical protein